MVEQERYASFSRSLETIIEDMANEATNGIRGVGPLFNPDDSLSNSRSESSRSAGAIPARLFVLVADENATDFLTLPAKKIKIPKSASSGDVLTLLKREIKDMENCRSITYYKSKSSGNHALQRVGENFKGAEILSNFKYSTTRVYVRQDSPSATVDIQFVPDNSPPNTTSTNLRTEHSNFSQECIKGITGMPYYGDHFPVGVVCPDYSDRGLEQKGLFHAPLADPIQIIKSAKAEGLPFVGLTFQCLCHHIRYDLRPAVIFITQKSGQLAICEKELLCTLNETYVSMSNRTNNITLPLFWTASTDSIEGMEAMQSLGNQTTVGEYQLCVISPSLRGNLTPTIIERFTDATEVQLHFMEALDKATQAVEVAESNHKQMVKERQLKEEQERALVISEETDARKDRNKEDTIINNNNKGNTITDSNREDTIIDNKDTISETDISNQKEIRLARARRLNAAKVDNSGVEVKVHTPIGLHSRTFQEGAFYQEVYDWVGVNEGLPLHYALIRFATEEVVLPMDKIRAPGEVLKMVEKDKKELTSILSADVVSFRGTVPTTSDVDRTLTDGEEVKEMGKEKTKKSKSMDKSLEDLGWKEVEKIKKKKKLKSAGGSLEKLGVKEVEKKKKKLKSTGESSEKSDDIKVKKLEKKNKKTKSRNKSLENLGDIKVKKSEKKNKKTKSRNKSLENLDDRERNKTKTTKKKGKESALKSGSDKLKEKKNETSNNEEVKISNVQDPKANSQTKRQKRRQREKDRKRQKTTEA